MPTPAHHAVRAEWRYKPFDETACANFSSVLRSCSICRRICCSLSDNGKAPPISEFLSTSSHECTDYARQNYFWSKSLGPHLEAPGLRLLFNELAGLIEASPNLCRMSSTADVVELHASSSSLAVDDSVDSPNRLSCISGATRFRALIPKSRTPAEISTSLRSGSISRIIACDVVTGNSTLAARVITRKSENFSFKEIVRAPTPALRHHECRLLRLNRYDKSDSNFCNSEV
ncbi:MAG: hypothetical protein RIS81_155 [Actinomycetota bacterium]